MSQLPAELHNIPLFNLAIPGKQVKPRLEKQHTPFINQLQICSIPSLSSLYMGRDQVKIKNFHCQTFWFWVANKFN